jgi:hypothetical protein
MDLDEQAHRVTFMTATVARTSPARSTRFWPAPGSGPCSATCGRPA